MWHFMVRYFKSLSIWVPSFWKARPFRRAQHPGNRVYCSLPAIRTLAQMEAGSPHRITKFLLIHRVLWDPHQKGSQK